MNKSIIFFVTLASSLLFSNNLFAVTVTAQTNIDGVIIKEFECFSSDLWGTLVNRTNQSLKDKYVSIKVFDSDGDPIGQCGRRIDVGPKSGDHFRADDCNCENAESYVITINNTR